MGVYIKGMEMPRRCEECPCMCEVDVVQGTACGCKLTMKIREIDNDTRPDWCPLIPVPPHGDLIDRKPFVEFIKTHWDSYDQWFVEQLEARPTIIPAEEGER